MSKHVPIQEFMLVDVYREVRFWINLIERGEETLDSAYAQITMTPRQAYLLNAPASSLATRALTFREQIAAGLQQWSVTGARPYVDPYEKETNVE